MSEANDIKKYLDFTGLEKYDKLIKSYIAKSKKSLEDDVKELKDDVAELSEAYKSADDTLETSLKGYVDNAVTAATNEDIDNLFK